MDPTTEPLEPSLKRDRHLRYFELSRLPEDTIHWAVELSSGRDIEAMYHSLL
jgi:hypothetical protein